ncbi:hypothetical protein SAMN05880582_106109 [Rhizobium sp. RU20A]|uniref:hypothetical protein n=1 Tax=Rhizobium sp. RU20A TaxID=1907412 RepID=UPI0009566135|nr:hypothetical protein [Rhizobium sp. RU20A]SIR08391.1 hypothetical protein SAMN05880582_106109 [Rhizobium sp. RU20A]
MTAIALTGASAPLPMSAFRPQPAPAAPVYVDEPLADDSSWPSVSNIAEPTDWQSYTPAEVLPDPQPAPVYVDAPLFDPNAPDEAVIAAGRALRAPPPAAATDEMPIAPEAPVVYRDEPLYDPNAPDEAILAAGRALRITAEAFAATFPSATAARPVNTDGLAAAEARSRENAVNALAARTPTTLLALSSLSGGALLFNADNAASETPATTTLGLFTAGYREH